MLPSPLVLDCKYHHSGIDTESSIVHSSPSDIPVCTQARPQTLRQSSCSDTHSGTLHCTGHGVHLHSSCKWCCSCKWHRLNCMLTIIIKSVNSLSPHSIHLHPKLTRALVVLRVRIVATRRACGEAGSIGQEVAANAAVASSAVAVAA